MNGEYLHACTKPEKQLDTRLPECHLSNFWEANISVNSTNKIYSQIRFQSFMSIHDKNTLTNILALSVNILIIRSKLVT